MAIREILTYPDPRLRRKARPVTVFDDDLRRLVADMAETMYDAPGVGLAATQIGVDLQVVVMDISPKDERHLQVLVNPQVEPVDPDDTTVENEGCLSVLDYQAKVKRPRRVRVRARTLEGKEVAFEAEDWFARVIQHEVDHLHGILYIDRISRLKRSMYDKKIKKMLREKARAAGREAGATAAKGAAG